MTRFARAKGSKASNERAPEDSTPWEVMKDQLLQSKKESEESKKRQEAEQQRIENYENFLKEQKVQKRKATWCDFPESEKKNVVTVNSEVPKKKKKHNNSNGKNEFENNKAENVETTQKKKAKKNKNLNKEQNNSVTEKTASVELSHQEENTNIEHKKKKKIKKKKNNNDNNIETDPAEQVNNNNNKKKKVKSENSKDLEQNRNNTDQSNQDFNSKKKQKKNKNSQKNEIENMNENSTENNQVRQKSMKKKMVDGQPVRRKPINDRSFQLIINGKEVELVRFDGFPIMKRDAERLEELKNNMIKKGIPKSEVQRTLKLERRRAEKALARLKKDVCYNCRKGGHNLSDCPELKSKIPGVGAADGMCFKCGSTEHRQFECKVQKDKEFRFATCFICKEPGHIARQCPDNPKGLYPNGGCCKLCGDVTHLRKDCPTVNEKKEGSSIKLQTLDSIDNIEGIEQSSNITSNVEQQKKPKKIKF